MLAIDLGTGGPKVALVAVDGTTIAWSSRPVATRFIDGGGAEQDPREMWTAIVDATRATLAAVSPTPPIVGRRRDESVHEHRPRRRQGYADRAVRVVDGHPRRRAQPVVAQRRVVRAVRRTARDDPAAERQRQHRSHPRAARRFTRTPTARPPPSSNRWTTSTPDSPAASVRHNRRCSGSWCATTDVWGLTEYDPDLVAATGLDPDKLPPLLPMNGIVGTADDALRPASWELPRGFR